MNRMQLPPGYRLAETIGLEHNKKHALGDLHQRYGNRYRIYMRDEEKERN